MKTKKQTKSDSERAAWVHWLATYGPAEFYDAFMQTAQDAESVCVHCRASIYLDIREGGGVPDWRTAEGDYGCDRSPDTIEEVGVGSHECAKN